MGAERAKRIAELNDRFRAALGTCCGVPGMAVTTSGIAALPDQAMFEVLMMVRDFHTFNEDGDPHREHDFGAFSHHLAEKVFWKIDYYADADCLMGSADPADTNQCYRVLTIMLASEY